MFGVTSTSIDGVSCWITPGSQATGLAQRQLEVVQRRRSASSPITTMIRGWTIAISSVDAREADRVGQRAVADRALHAERAVDGERVDAEAAERLAQRGAGAAVERDALLDLGDLRRVLQQQHVGLRVAGAEHGHQAAARAVAAGLDVARQRVHLADGALEVLLADLVVGGGHGCTGIRRSRRVSLAVHQALRVARRTRRCLTDRRAPSGVALVCRNFSACT